MNEQTTLVSVAMAALSALASFGSAYLSYRTNRDKLQYDAEAVSLRAQVATLTQRVTDCHEDRDELRGRIEKLEGKA